MVFPLCDLKAGETAQVAWIISEPAMERRLSRLGFRFGEPVTCIFKSKTAGSGSGGKRTYGSLFWR